MDWTNKLKELQKPFNFSDIKWRIGKTNKDKTSGLVFAYVSNRAIQNRFDEVFGINGWKNEYKEWHNNKVELDLEGLIKVSKSSKWKTAEEIAGSFYKDYITQSQLCGISVWDDDKKEWVTKWDGADNTNFEKTKGGLSDSMKRAAYQWGVGRYLYDLPSQWVDIEDGYGGPKIKKGCYPSLPAWAYDQGHVDDMKVGILEKKAKKKGLSEDKICAKYFVESFGALNLNQFKEASKLLEQYADVKEGEEPILIKNLSPKGAK